MRYICPDCKDDLIANEPCSCGFVHIKSWPIDTRAILTRISQPAEILEESGIKPEDGWDA